jgi:prolyl-tRNA synthetase
MLRVPKRKTAKAVFMMAGHENETGAHEEFIIAIVRGDMEVNETKLANAAKANSLRPATDEEIRANGAVPGYASPIGLRGANVIVDEAIITSPNLVAGANEEGYHLLNTNAGRDYEATVIADIAAAGDGDACTRCGEGLYTSRGVEVGNIFKLGTRYSAAVGALYLDADGKEKPVVMGSYGIGSGRLLACIAEEHHDDQGLLWPITVAPYDVHLISLGQKEEADRVHLALEQARVEVLYDDREESPGVKFKDADLIGIPIRITVSARSLAKGGVEVKRRDRPDLEIVQEALLIAHLKAKIQSLLDDIRAKAVEVPFK